jgi:hypothetical protein
MPETKYTENVAVTSREDASGETWFTARCRTFNLDDEHNESTFDQQLLLAEGGSSGRYSGQKIYWYPSEKDTREALTTVVIVSHWAAKQMIEPPFGMLGPWDLYVKESGLCGPNHVESDPSHCEPASRSGSEREWMSFASDHSHSVPPRGPVNELKSPSPLAKRRRSTPPNREPEQQCILRIPTTGRKCFLLAGETICSRISCPLGKECSSLHIQRAPYGSLITSSEVDMEDPFSRTLRSWIGYGPSTKKTTTSGTTQSPT